MEALIIFGVILLAAVTAGIVLIIRGARTAISKDRKLETLQEQRKDIISDVVLSAGVLTAQYKNGINHDQIPRLVAILDLHLQEYFRNEQAIANHEVDVLERKVLD